MFLPFQNFYVLCVPNSLIKKLTPPFRLALNQTQWLVTANADVSVTAAVLLVVPATVVSRVRLL